MTQVKNETQLIKGEKVVDKMSYEVSYNKDEIPSSLIEECNNLCKETGLLHFIFDFDTKNKISSLSYKSEDEKREEVLESLLDENNGFYIANEDEFNSMPSRYSLYDTETRCVGRYDRYNKVLDFIKKIGFEASTWNLGPEYEQTFSINEKKNDSVSKWTLRLKYNMFLTIEHFYSNDTEGQNEIIYDRFFNKNIILQSLMISNKSFFEAKIRDMKLDNILC